MSTLRRAERPSQEVIQVVPVIHGNTGWLFIPNFFVDQLFALLPGEYVKVLLFMWRRTKGWNKWEDSISISQMARETGVCRNTATAAAKLFVELSLFSDVGNGVRGARRYRIGEADVNKIVSRLKCIPLPTTKAPAHPMSTTCSPHEQVTCSPGEHTINNIENTYQEDSASPKRGDLFPPSEEEEEQD
jgi:hypothetical protein